MQITDFPTDTTNEYSELKSKLRAAVSQVASNTEKTLWLTGVLNACVTAATAPPTVIQVSEFDVDTKSNNSEEELKNTITRALAKNTTRGAADNTKLAAIFTAAVNAI